MVLINGVKYACERCIRGHRVTTCTHQDQPLMMIKPKGRPSTQCQHCKEQRRLKSQHIKCSCGDLKAHTKDCACYVEGKCTCKSKKKPVKKEKEKSENDESPPIRGGRVLAQGSMGHDPKSDYGTVTRPPSRPISVEDSSRKPLPVSDLQVGMETLGAYKQPPAQTIPRAGEITVPFDEYIMGGNLNTLIEEPFSEKLKRNDSLDSADAESSEKFSPMWRDDSTSNLFADLPSSYFGSGLLDYFPPSTGPSPSDSSSTSLNKQVYHQVPLQHRVQRQSTGNSMHSSNHHGHHHYHHHYAPYPAPKRTDSVLSIASSNASFQNPSSPNANPPPLLSFASTDSLAAMSRSDRNLDMDYLSIGAVPITSSTFLPQFKEKRDKKSL